MVLENSIKLLSPSVSIMLPREADTLYHLYSLDAKLKLSSQLLGSDCVFLVVFCISRL